STISPTACDSYTAPGGTVYSASGTYTDVVLNAAGCDSVITINLTINGSSLNNMTASACDSYTLNGQTYTSTGAYTQNLPGAASNGCDSTIILDLTITGSSFATINETACGSYTINGNTYTTSGTYVETLAGASANGCDSIVTVNLTILNATFNTITDAACDIYTLNAQTYTSSGAYTQTLTNAAGCDSTITLNLTINYTTGTTLTEAACNSYTLNAQTYTSSGTYSQTLTNAAGCDSIITLNLTIGTLNTNATINEVACDLYTAPSGAVYTSTGTYTDIIPNASGCDSVITINVTVNTATASVLNEFSCGGYTMNGQTYTGSGTYVQVITNAAGCDSTITLNLTVGSPNSSTLSVEECDSYTLNGQTYTASGTYLQVLTNVEGCDSTITLDLTINNTVNVLNELTCGSYTLNGQTYTSSGTYTQLLPGVAVGGCDSTIMLNLTVNPVDNVVIDTAACNSFTMNGQTYTSSGMYVQNLTNVYGCDSIVTLDLTIGTSNSFAAITEVVCDSYIAPSGVVYSSSGTYVDVIQNVSGCDSIITINLTINSATSSTLVAEDCISYTLNGQTYTATGVYSQVFTNTAGCDSTITLDLTINATDTSITTVGCNSYSLNGITYTSSGIYTQTLINAAGCDSIITLDVTIGTQPSSSSITEVACDTYISPSGMLYTTSGVYSDIIPNAAGCDSVITITLTINSSSSSTLNETVCSGYTLNGTTYTSSGIYAQTFVNATGCDSTITLNLTVNANDTLLTIASCNIYTLNGITYSSSGTYTQVLTNTAGCDSTLTIDLTIGTQASSSTITEVVCDSYVSPVGLTYTASGVYVDTIPNAVGCDSVITIILTVYNSTSSIDMIEACDTYTWIDGNTYASSNNTVTYTMTNAAGCDSTIYLDLTINQSTSSTIIADATDSYTMNGQTYTQSGVYTQVIPNAAGCDSTITLDVTIGYTGIEENEEIWLSLYPNPSYGQITIQGLESIKDVESIYMTDARGRLVRVFEPNTTAFDISDVVIGMYHIHIKYPGGIETLKVIKQ
ncbi:T9SS type A sorting domain-containing protein, partial [Crocinitomicaceae bacterium]|nr:T9SS type A sorting domain-containing protein [Crocinitomicaceae bacterium]